jgi:hypothetical protein
MMKWEFRGVFASWGCRQMSSFVALEKEVYRRRRMVAEALLRQLPMKACLASLRFCYDNSNRMPLRGHGANGGNRR